MLGGSCLRSTASRERHQASRSNYERQLLHPHLPTLLARWRLPPSAAEPSRNCPPVNRSFALAFGSPRLYGRSGDFCCCIAQDRKSNTSELQSLMRISYAVFCLKKKNKILRRNTTKKQKHKTKTNETRQHTHLQLTN